MYFLTVIFIEIDFHFLILIFLKFMQSNTATKFSPAISDDKKLEVSLETNEVVLKFSNWTESLGWTCQKTMRIEEAMIDDLHRVISAARYKINQRNADSNEKVLSNVISFPKAA